MTQKLLDEYDELVGNICEEITEIFDESIENHMDEEFVLGKTLDYMDSNKTSQMVKMLKVSSQNPKLVFYLLSQLSAQFSCYQIMAEKLMESFLELHPGETIEEETN